MASSFTGFLVTLPAFGDFTGVPVDGFEMNRKRMLMEFRVNRRSNRAADPVVPEHGYRPSACRWRRAPEPARDGRHTIARAGPALLRPFSPIIPATIASVASMIVKPAVMRAFSDIREMNLPPLDDRPMQNLRPAGLLVAEQLVGCINGRHRLARCPCDAPTCSRRSDRPFTNRRRRRQDPVIVAVLQRFLT